MVLARCCGLSSVAPVLAALFDQKPDNLRQRLHEFYKDAADKAGAKRKALQVETVLPVELVTRGEPPYVDPHVSWCEQWGQ